MEETFYPWDLTVRRFAEEGLARGARQAASSDAQRQALSRLKSTFNQPAFEGVFDYESWLGFDSGQESCL